MIHINLNMIFYTLVEHSPTKTIYIKYYEKKKKKRLGHWPILIGGRVCVGGGGGGGGGGNVCVGGGALSHTLSRQYGPIWTLYYLHGACFAYKNSVAYNNPPPGPSITYQDPLLSITVYGPYYF